MKIFGLRVLANKFEYHSEPGSNFVTEKVIKQLEIFFSLFDLASRLTIQFSACGQPSASLLHVE